MASASPATLPDSIRLNAPPLRSLLHFFHVPPALSKAATLIYTGLLSTRFGFRIVTTAAGAISITFSSRPCCLPRTAVTPFGFAHVHSFIWLCLSLPLFHDSIPSFRLRYRSSVDQTSCSQPAANFFVPFNTPGRCHEPRLPPEPLRSFDLDPAQEARAKLYIYSFGPLNSSPLLGRLLLTIITTSHRLRWTFTFDSIRPSKPSEACFYT